MTPTSDSSTDAEIDEIDREIEQLGYDADEQQPRWLLMAAVFATTGIGLLVAFPAVGWQFLLAMGFVALGGLCTAYAAFVGIYDAWPVFEFGDEG